MINITDVDENLVQNNDKFIHQIAHQIDVKKRERTSQAQSIHGRLAAFRLAYENMT